MCWNCKGANGKGFHPLIKDIGMEYSMSMLILMETQISGVKADKVISELRFNSSMKVDTIGRSGGGESWTRTVVYGSPNFSIMNTLWEILRSIAEGMTTPWCLMGDFNVVASDSEREGSSSPHPSRGASAFASFINSSHLIDMGFSGSWFTWTKGGLKERLDRVLANLEWRLKFPLVEVFHLNPMKSDHSPLLLSLLGALSPNLHQRPFRMLVASFSHPSFEDLIRKIWEPHRSWQDAISNLQNKLKVWNKEVFGNIFRKKKKDSSQKIKWDY
ncbi:PREDICTED: uncharacterized protein LOC109344534 [Lupinus angustifolius]|uniref:uncharacterized protein LOC109344534 n=1 Tax=Lupinus angustifolius TaxID=3871 RepID=UPI00092EA833|nr:PREDICTED: uncharacterized protein LOC109344534 [Lupinus angustifolius]